MSAWLTAMPMPCGRQRHRHTRGHEDNPYQPLFAIRPDSQGTGPGLPITDDNVTDLHGDLIAVDNEGEGSTVFVATNPRQVSANEGRRA
jgi:signal transduction histidine kinase